MSDVLFEKRKDYIRALIRYLERRAVDGELDTALAARIERLLGEDHADGEAEYASWKFLPSPLPSEWELRKDMEE